MKTKKILFIPLTLAIGVLTLSVISVAKYHKVNADDPEPSSSSEPVAQTTEANHYLPFNDTNFTKDGAHGYARLGTIYASDKTTWSGRFNALDSFFSGESSGIGEGETGYFDSVSWYQKLSNPYVYFTLGANTNNYVEVIRKNGGTVLGSTNNDQFNGNPMVMNYLKINTAGLSENEEVFLRIHDNSGSDYGFVTFGYLHVNATAKDVSDAIWAHINSLTIGYDAGNNEANYRIRETMNIYLNGKASTDNILLLSDNKNLSVNEDFEDNATFLNHWYRDTTYDWVVDGGYSSANINDRYDKGWDSIISYGTQHRHERMPFNKTDNGFFKGYREAPEGTDDVTGFMNTDASKYRFVSKPFVLSGEGFVSIKMSGHPASLHVLRGNTELAFIDIKTNSREGQKNNITTGYNCLTMVRHVINLSAFKGQVIQLAIADVNCVDDYGAVNYDELITKYDNNPLFKVDTVVQFDNINNYYLDFYVPMTNNRYGVGVDYKDDDTYNIESDNTPVKEAYDFLSNYYSSLRAPGNQFNYSKANVVAKANALNAYLDLSSDAKTIVNGSTDIQYDSAWSNDWYANAVNVSSPISTAFSTLLDNYAQIQIEAAPTKTTLSFSYTGDVEHGFEFTNIKIRFKGALDSSLWAELNTKSEIKGYGVMISLDSTKDGYIGSKHFKDEYAAKLAANGNDVDAAISALIGTNTKIQNHYKSYADESPFSNGAKMSWALPQSVSYSSSTTKIHVLTRTYVAVAYIKTNDGLVFLDEARVSVKDLAQQMFDSGDYPDLSEPLTYLKDLSE